MARKSRSKSNTSRKHSIRDASSDTVLATPVPRIAPVGPTGRRFVRLPGTDKRYYDTETGQNLSRYAYQKLSPQIRDETLSREALTERRYVQARYNALVSDYTRKLQKTDPTMTLGKARTLPRFNELQRELLAKNKNGSPSASRIKAALDELGRREGLPRSEKLGASAKNYKRNSTTGIWERN